MADGNLKALKTKQMLEDRKWYTLLLAFCKDNYSDENPEFLRSVTVWKPNPSTKMARVIAKRFIRRCSPGNQYRRRYFKENSGRDGRTLERRRSTQQSG